jgi:hypothetical protein
MFVGCRGDQASDLLATDSGGKYFVNRSSIAHRHFSPDYTRFSIIRAACICAADAGESG